MADSQRPPSHADLLRRFRGGAAREDRRARRRRRRAAAPPARAGTRHPPVHAVLLEHRHSGVADGPGRRRAEHRAAPRRTPLSLLAARDSAARLEGAAVSRPLPAGLRPADDLHDRPRRASAVPGPAARRTRRLSAHEVRAAHRSLQRLAHGAAADDAEDAVRVGQLVSRDAHGHVDPQHRLPGLVRCRDDVRRRRQCLGPAGSRDARGRRIQLAARRCAQRRRCHDGEPDVCGRNRHAAGRPRSRRRATRSQRWRARHSQRRRLHRVEPGDRPLSEASLFAAGPVGQSTGASARSSIGSTCPSTPHHRCWAWSRA